MEKIKKGFIYLLLIFSALTLLAHFTNMFIAIAFIGVIIFLATKLNLPKFGLWLFIVALVMRCIVVLLIDSPIISDYRVMYDMASEISAGNLFAAADSHYMLVWGYQMGYTLFMTLIMMISHGALLIKLVNCVFTALIVLFIYLIAKELTNQKVARIVGILYMLFPFPLFLNTILSNQHISSFMFLLAVYLLISKKTEAMNVFLKFFLIGLCLAIGNIIRPEAIVFLGAIFLYFVFTTKKVEIKNTVKKLLTLFITYLCITTLTSFILTSTGISPSGLDNTAPLWKFTVGFNPENNGEYSEPVAQKFFSISEEEQKDMLYDYTIGSLDTIPSLLLYKAQHFWLDGDMNYSLDYLNGKTVSILGIAIPFDNIRTVLDNINQYYIYMIFILSLIAVFIKRKNMDNNQFLLAMILLVYAGVYLLIEITPKYAYTPQIFLFLMSAYTIYYFMNHKFTLTEKKPLVLAKEKAVKEKRTSKKKSTSKKTK